MFSKIKEHVAFLKNKINGVIAPFSEKKPTLLLSVGEHKDSMFFDKIGSDDFSVWVRPDPVFVPSGFKLMVVYNYQTIEIHMRPQMFRRFKNMLRAKKRNLKFVQVVYPDSVIEYFSKNNDTQEPLYVKHYLCQKDRIMKNYNIEPFAEVGFILHARDNNIKIENLEDEVPYNLSGYKLNIEGFDALEPISTVISEGDFHPTPIEIDVVTKIAETIYEMWKGDASKLNLTPYSASNGVLLAFPEGELYTSVAIERIVIDPIAKVVSVSLGT